MSDFTMNPQFLKLGSLLPDGVFMTDRAGRITYVSEKAQALLGRPAHELVGRPFAQFLDPSVRDAGVRALSQSGSGATGTAKVDLLMLGRGKTPFPTRLIAGACGDGTLGVLHECTAAEPEPPRLQEHRLYRDRGLTLLHLFTEEITSLPPDANIFASIGRGLLDFTGARFVVLSEYDPDIRGLRNRHYETDPSLVARVIGMLGTRVEDLVVHLSDEALQAFTGKGWISESSLHEVSFGAIPRPVADAVQRFLDVDRFIGLSFIYSGTIYGTSLIALQPQTPEPPMEILQAFRHTAAIALRCRALETSKQGR